MSDDKKRVLILEDSDIFADMLLGFFDSFDYKIERAVNGFEGIKKIYTFLPHIVITDIEMPLFKGYQVTRFLKSRKNTKSIPVIMLTTLNEKKDKFWGDVSGADKYVEKTPENFRMLGETVKDMLSACGNIDFTAIEREGRKINDNSIIEIVNNMLDNKLFQTTITGMLTELSCNVKSMEMVAQGIFNLLQSVCEAEIATLMIRGANKILYTYTANTCGFTDEIFDNFLNINISDFNHLFPGYKYSDNIQKDFFPAGTNKKTILSYITVPLTVAGEIFAVLHIANSINDYFTHSVMENVNIFTGAASSIIANSLSMYELSVLQENTRTAFARYVPADVMDEIINETANKVRMSENRNVSILFSDIRNFTNISEHAQAKNVVNFLNMYFSKMGEKIISEGGHIDKFIGDAIMAVFGAFSNIENSQISAIRAALKMLEALDEINAFASENSHNKIEIGIGINCGSCILGNIGFQNKMDYTVIGDTVNLASRIEALTKFYRHPIIVSEYIHDAVKENFITRKIDNVRVKGKEKPVGIYSVYSGFLDSSVNRLRSGNIADVPVIPSLLINRETITNYNKGLKVFYMREWKLAQEYFQKSLDADANDYLSLLYLERTKEFAQNPPPEDWDGVFTLTQK